MSVIIGSARSDEHGRITGGVAGDQTGREVCRENYYVPKQGWNLLRPKSSEIAEKIASNMEYACDNNNIGYDQSNNQSLYREVEPYKFDCRKATKPCEVDCSQLVRVCVSYAVGKSVPYFYTGDEVEVLMKTGLFDLHTDSKYTTSDYYLKRGDILVTKTKGHTVVSLSNGGYYDKKVKENGTWDKSTTKELQRIYSTPVDGEIWNQPRSNKKYLKNCSTSSWKFKLKPKVGSPLIKNIQSSLKITADGWCGINTVKAIQKSLKRNGLYTGEIDGYMGYNTVLALQKFINKYYQKLTI